MEVIHLLSPDANAVRPSKLIANLLRTKGRFNVILLINPRFKVCASSINKPQLTSQPEALSLSSPRPETNGLGSCIATTTRLTPAFIKASQQGGVLP